MARWHSYLLLLPWHYGAQARGSRSHRWPAAALVAFRSLFPHHPAQHSQRRFEHERGGDQFDGEEIRQFFCEGDLNGPAPENDHPQAMTNQLHWIKVWL